MAEKKTGMKTKKTGEGSTGKGKQHHPNQTPLEKEVQRIRDKGYTVRRFRTHVHAPYLKR